MLTERRPWSDYEYSSRIIGWTVLWVTQVISNAIPWLLYKQQRWKLFCFLYLHPGVFFVVCMALLMLSLIKSILVVKLLHHSEKEVRQMSVSACLLDKYGSARHDFTESALTSIKTLDYTNPSGGKLQVLPKVLLMADTSSVFLLNASPN